MKDNRNSWIKRTVALMLTISLVLSSAVDIVPGRYSARAEDIQENQAAATPDAGEPLASADDAAIEVSAAIQDVIVTYADTSADEAEEIIVEAVEYWEEEAEPEEAPAEEPEAEEPAPAVEPEAAPVEVEEPAPAVEPEAAPVEAEEPAPAVEPEAAPVEAEEPAPAVEPEAEEPAPAAEPEAAPVEAEEPAPAVEPEAEEPAPAAGPEAAPAAEPASAPATEVDPVADPAEAPEADAQPAEAQKPATPFDVALVSTAPVSADEAAEDANNNEETASDETALVASDAPATVTADADGKEDTPKISALQQMIQDKIKSADSLNERITLILKKNTTYEGDLEIKKDDGKTYGDDFGIDIVAENAGDDNLQADASTVIAGNVTIQGVSVMIAGISVAAGKKVSVSKGELDYYGTKKDDTLTVEASDKATVNIETGDGDNTVTVDVSQSSTANIKTGDGADKVTANVTESDLTVDAGNGDNDVKANIGPGSAATIKTGSGDDSIALTDASEKDVTVDAGEGKNKLDLDVRPGMRNLNVTMGDGNDNIVIGTKGEDITGSPVGNVTVNMGGGVNETTVDLGTAAAVRDIKVVGGESSDHVRFTGELDDNTNEDKRITGTAEDLTFAGSKGNLHVTTEGVENLTDELINKRTVKLVPNSDGTMTTTADQPFTNYLINAPASELKNILITSKDGKDLVLSGVIIDTPTTVDGENKLVISEDATIDVGNLRLILKARNIEVNGTLKAGMVNLEASDGTGMYYRNYSDLYNHYNGGSSTGALSLGAAAVAGLDKLWDYVNVNDKATIVIGEKGAVYSSGDVILISKVVQTPGLIAFLNTVNLVDVKIAHASIDVAGKVYAGYDFKTKETAENKGSVTMDARVSTTIGYKDNDELGGFPLAVSVASTEAKVNVKNGALVDAGKDISISANSEQKIATRADSGLFGLPAAIAVSVLINEAKSVVDGTAVAKSGNVKVNAAGKISSATIADKGKDQESISGGYIAVGVALQDVKAELADHADVTAGGGVTVKSSATEKVNTHAVAGEQKTIEGGGTNTDAADAVKMVANLWTNLKEKISSPDAKDKIDGAMKKLTTSSNSVRIDDQADRKGTVKVDTTNAGDHISVSVNVEPWPSYRVKKITVRGMVPGEEKYLIQTVDSSNSCTLPMQAKDLTVFVEYEEIESGDDSDTAADLFEDKKPEEEDSDAALALYGDVANSINDPGDDDDDDEIDTSHSINDVGDDDDDDEIDTSHSINDVDDNDDDEPSTTPDSENQGGSGENEENPERDPNLNGNGLDPIDLSLSGSGGAVLTYETKDNAPDESLDKVYKGDKVRLIPNPGENKKLKDGGLVVVYWVEDGDKLVSKKEIVNPDGQNRYYFTVPQELDVKSGIQVSGTFVDSGVNDKKADETKTQITGTVAVTVAKNDSMAVIAQGAAVKAGGSVNVTSDTHTNVTDMADGTAIGKKGEEAKKEGEDLKIKRPDTQTYTGFDQDNSGGAQAYPLYSLRLDATENGKVTYEADSSKNYKYTFSATPDEGYKVAKATLIVYKEGKAETIELKAKNGVYTVDLGESAEKGTLSQVCFTFAKEGVYGEVNSTQEAQMIIPNAVRISYNQLTNESNKDKPISVGTVYFDKTETKDGKITAYVFSATPETAKGYVLDGKLKAEWTNAAGQKQTRELKKQDDGKWALDPTGIPGGALITVNGAFKADLHELKVDSDKIQNGKVTAYDDKVMRTDTPKFTVKPDAGFSLTDVVVTVNGTTQLKLSSGALVKAKDKDGKEIENVYTLKEGLPALKADSKVSVSATFTRKGIGVRAGENDTDKNITLSEKNVAVGDKVTVKPNDDKTKAGYKVSEIVVKNGDKEVYKGSADSFKVPDDAKDGDKLTVTATLKEKEIALESAKLTGGEVKPNIARADRGETVTVTVKPDNDMKVKAGTLKAVIKATDGSYTEEAYMARSNDTTYTFIMPASIDDPSKVTVSFTGVFEPGQSDSSAVETSVGAGIAVNVVNSESRAEIRGDVSTKGSVSAKSTQDGGATAQAKAGYSKGKIGIGGAVSVQVASLDSKALIYKSADIKLDGTLTVSATANTAFTVTGDASGSKAEAEKAGVGAGIAVAVNGSDAFAAVQDGAKLAAKTAEAKVRGVAVSAEQKTKDSVTAKAGAAGGTAVVPVAAVDVIGVSAKAYMGKVNDGEALDLSDSAKVSAKTSAEHKIAADASAAGKGAGIGGAFDVSVLSDSAKAQLAQSVNTKNVSVSTETVSKAESTATASASGGEKKGKSADKQSDSLLGAGGKLAGKNKSSGVSTGKVDSAMKNRQKSETSEGSVGVAGAVVVNVQSSESVSEVLAGVDIKAAGDVAVTAVNGTTSKVKANSSVTKSNIGVGVGVAVNIVSLNNIARLSDGEIDAAALTVSATTKETKPDSNTTVKGKAEKKVENKDGLAKQLGEMVTEYMYDLADEIGLGNYVSKDLLDKILTPLVTDTVTTLINATGLDTLFGSGDLKSKYETAKGLLLDEKKGLIALPQKLLQPVLSAMEEAEMLADMSAADIGKMSETLMEEYADQLLARFTSTDTLTDLLGEVKDGMIKYLKDNTPSILSGAFTAKLGSLAGVELQEDGDASVGDAFKELGNQIVKAAKKKLKDIFAESLKDTLQNVSVPGLNKKTIDKAVTAFKSLKNAYDNDSLDKIFDSACEYVTTTFRKEVFDYQKMFAALTAKDFKKKIADGLRTAAKNASVTLTNEAIGWLTSKMGVVIEPEQADSTGHVIDTQAIAGTGAKDVGIAGSVAITVMNATTAALIGESSDAKIDVTNGMTVEAVEKRSVKNVASAAVDNKGNAAANKSAEGTANQDVGDGSSGKSTATGKHVTMEAGVGATARILESDLADNKPKVRIDLKEGFKLPTDSADKPIAEYTYTDKDGYEVHGTVEIQKDSTGYYVDPSSGELAKAGKDTDVKLELTPVEVLHGVPQPDASLTDVTLEEGAVTISAKDRTVENNKLMVRPGEKVEVRVAKKAGREVNGIGFSYVNDKGERVDVEAIPVASSTSKEIIYTFDMPDAEVTDFVVSFIKSDSEEEPEPESSAKDGSGKSVGVGAAFSMVYGDTEVTAKVGSRKEVTTGALTMNASSDHKEDIASAAGTDPLSGQLDMDNTKKTAVDATVSLNILDNDIKAELGAGATVKTNGFSASEGEEKKGDLSITANEKSATETTSSSFAVGGETAVGASVAINIASTGVSAKLLSDAEVYGSAEVSANTHSEDKTNAFATAMGADIARNLVKAGEKAENIESKSNDLLSGSYFDKKEDKNSTDTNKKITNKLNSNEKKAEDGDKANTNNSVSTNVLRSQGVKVENEEAGKEGTDEAGSQITETTKKDLGSLTGDKKEEKKFQVAAAVGLTIASHNASTAVGAITAGKDIKAAAENTGNFNTLGTGAAMSLVDNANSIAAGVAVSVNSNSATVKATGNLVSENQGDITVTSKLTQNMDGEFKGKLAAQSLAGAASGKDSKISLAGAISVVVSKAESSVDVAGGTKKAKRDITGGNVVIEATDKSKLAARAGGLSLSKGSSVGMGVASTTIVSSNQVTATVGNYANIVAGSFKLNAEKKQVTFDDYENQFGLTSIVTDSSKLSEDQRKNANTGLIDIHKGEDDKSYSVDVNVTSDKLLSAVDALNILSSQNIYAEAIAGSAQSSAKDVNANLAGSFAVAVSKNKVNASLGENASVELTSDDKHDGSMTVNASNGSTARIIAGSLSAAPAKVSVGATVAVLVDHNEVKAETGDDAEIEVDGDFNHTAKTDGITQVFTAAMSASTAQAGTAVGGAINVIVSGNKAESNLGASDVTVGGSANVTSKTAFDLMAISGSASASTGAGVAAGGTINVIVDSSSSKTNLGIGTVIEASKDITIASDVSDQMISGTASLSAASKGSSGAGVVNVVVSKSVANTKAGRSFDFNSKKGNLAVTANNDAWMLNASVAASGGKNTAVGAAFNINVFNREATVDLSGGRGNLKAGGDITTQASGKDTSIIAGLAVAGSNDSALAGNFDVMVENNTIETKIGQNTTVSAGGNALVESYFSDFTVAAAGTIAVSTGSGTNAGATVLTVVKNNVIDTVLDRVTVTASGKKGTALTAKSGDEVKGVYVGANAKETQFVGGAGVAGGRGTSVNGVVAVMVNNNQVIANAATAVLEAEADDGSVSVKAQDDTWQTVIAGGVNFSATGAAAGAAVVTVVSNKTVEAKAHDMTAGKDVNVIADNHDELFQLAVSAGISGSGAAVQLGADIQVLKSTARAIVASDVTARTGNFNLQSSNDTNLTNVSGAAAGSGGSAAVAPVAAITYFKGTSEAILDHFANLKVEKGSANIKATSNKDIGMYTVGVAVSGGSAGLSGVANILVSSDTANAIVRGDDVEKDEKGEEVKLDGAVLDVEGNVNVESVGDYKLRTASASLAGSSGAGIAVNAVVSRMKSQTLSSLGGETTAGGAVKVDANAKRDIINTIATVGVGGSAGVGVAVMVLSAGTKMSQDAADMIAYGNADKKDEKNKSGLDATKLLGRLKANGVETEYFEDDLNAKTLEDDLAGNGHNESKTKVGHKNEGSSVVEFDGTTGYVDDDFQDQKYDNNSEEGRGEDLKAKDTADIDNAKKLNSYTYSDDDLPDDAVIARILGDAEITADSVAVSATQPTSADLYGVEFVAGGSAGVGVSASVALLRSNVLASSNGWIKKATNGVSITATSKGTTDARDADSGERDSKLASVLSELNPANRAIRVIGMTAAVGGNAGVAVAASVLLTDSMTQAKLGGRVENAASVSVKADHNYDNVMAATVAIGAGAFAGVAASVSVAQANGTVAAEIGRDASVTTSGNVEVLSNSKVDVNALAATASAGLAAFNGGVGLAINRLTQNTGIRSGANVTAGGNVKVNGISDTNANAFLAGVSVGGAAVSMNAAVTDVNATINTFIGETGKDADGEDLKPAIITADQSDVEISNDVHSASTPAVVSLAAGLGALGGNALLAFNNTQARAVLNNATMRAKDVTVVSDLAGEASSSLASLTIGAVAIGVSVNYADIQADNRAIVDTSGGELIVNGNLNVRTGVGDHNSTIASADTVAAEVGLATVSLNAAIARNNTKNYAIIRGTNPLTVHGDLFVHAAGQSTTNSKLHGISFALGSVAATAVVALNDADTRTQVGNIVETKKGDKVEREVIPLPNLTVDGTAYFDATQKGQTKANVVTGGGSLIGAALTVALAYGRTNSIVDVELSGDAKLGGISSTNLANDDVNSDIRNSSFSAISASALYGAAYSQDVFNSTIRLSEGNSEIGAKGVSILNDYDVKANANITPSTGGVDVSLGSLSANVAVAKSTAHAGANFESIKATTHVAGDLKVLTRGSANTDANVTTANVSVSALAVGANVAKADLSTIQAAYLRVGKTLNVDGAVDVESVVKNLTDDDVLAIKREKLRQWQKEKRSIGTYSKDGADEAVDDAWLKEDVDAMSKDRVNELYQIGGGSNISTGGAAQAKAKIGASGNPSDAVSVSLVGMDVNIARAKENMSNTAAIVGGPYDSKMVPTDVDKGHYEMVESSHYDYEVWRDEAYIVRDEKGNPVMTIEEYDDPVLGRQTREVPKWETGMHNPWITEMVEIWVEEIVHDEVKQDLYNAKENKLNAASLTMFSGAQNNAKTIANARTDGAKNIGLFTAGGLDAKATSNDTFSLLFEGMTATITNTAKLTAVGDTVAEAVGFTPGGISVADVSGSDVLAGVGTSDDRQTVAVIIGEGNTLKAGDIDISIKNVGSSKAILDQDTSYSLASVKKTTQPTHSWYNTLFSMGENATLESTSGDIKITTDDAPTANSIVNAANKSLLMNFNSMMGKNNIWQTTNVDFGNSATVTSANDVIITANQRTIANAATNLSGCGVLEGTTAKAENNIKRVVRTNIGDSTTITGKKIDILVISGKNDDIVTKANVKGDGFISMSNAKAYGNVESHSEITIGTGSTLSGTDLVSLVTRSTSYKKLGTPGISTEGIVDSAGCIPLPDAVARNTMSFNTFININTFKGKPGAKKTTITSEKGEVRMYADTESLTVQSVTSAKGKGAGGTSNANSWMENILTNAIVIDNTDVTAAKSIKVYADNGGTFVNQGDNYKTHNIGSSYAKLAGIGKVVAKAQITGEQINQIRCNNKSLVTFKAPTVIHESSSPENAVLQTLKVDTSVTKVFGIPLASAKKKSILEWYVFDRCDFCNKGIEYDVSPTAQETLQERYKDAFEKALYPINEIQRIIASLSVITKARYGEETQTVASKLFVLDLHSMLTKDVRLTAEDIEKYTMWFNMETFHNVQLLPNAAKLFTGAGNALQFVTDALNGDVLGDGVNHPIEVITALTEYAFKNPIIPIGSTGSLDLSTGTLHIPDHADYELYLHEVSSNWMMDMIDKGIIRRLDADQQAINGCALESDKLPAGSIVEGATDGGDLDGWKLYWVNTMPEEAKSDDQILLMLMVNEETDEIDAFRTSRSMIEADQDPIDVSVYLFRDSDSDRKGEEKYNAMFFDTPAGEKSIVKVITNVPDRETDIPSALEIVLRGYVVGGADSPAYSLNDHFFILCNGADGEVETLDGYYKATFDGDVFDSDYTRIEGIRDGNLVVTIKKDQPVWPEWTGEDTAEDIGGGHFQLVDGQWQEVLQQVMSADAN